MAIPPELKYDSEDDFVQRFLIPLLQRMGFSVVANYHGTSEFGKDLIFAEVDRFGHIRFHALQAKYVESVSLNASQELIADCEQAFATPFRHPQTGAEGRISSFYAVNAGSVSDQAKTHYFNALRPKFGDNTKFLEAKDLLVLDRWATANQTQNVTDLLSGLDIEIRYNAFDVLGGIKQNFEDALAKRAAITYWPLLRYRTDSTSAYLRQPFLADKLTSKMVLQYWHLATLMNREMDAVSGVMKPERREEVQKATLQHLEEFIPLGNELRLNIATVLRSLSALSAGLAASGVPSDAAV